MRPQEIQRYLVTRPRQTLGLIAVLSLGLYAWLTWGLEGGGGREDVTAFLVVMTLLFALYAGAIGVVRGRTNGSRTRDWQVVLAGAVLFRLLLLPAGLNAPLTDDLTSSGVAYQTFLLYDNDVWRYLWDGHVGASGLDPYIYSPADVEELAASGDPLYEPLLEEDLWFDIFDQVSYQEYATIYPPLAQLYFRAVVTLVPGSVFLLKLGLALIDIATCLLLAAFLRHLGQRRANVVIYAWNPLAVKEIAGSGHVDALMIFFVVLTLYCLVRGFHRAGLAAYALAILTKLTPIFLLPLILRRVPLRHWIVLPAVGFIFYLPFLGSAFTMLDSLKAFSRDWVFNPGPWAVVHDIAWRIIGLPGRTAADLFTLLALGIAIVWALRHDRAHGNGTPQSLITGAIVILGTYLVTSSTVMPWYLLWVLALTTLRPLWSWLALTWLSLLSYLVYVDGTAHSWWLWMEFTAFFLLLAWELVRSRERSRCSRT